MEPAKAAPWLALASLPDVGAQRFARLVSVFGHPAGVFESVGSQELASQKLPQPASDALKDLARNWGGRLGQAPGVAEVVEAAEREGLDVICLGTAEYPPSLARIVDPPPVLFRRGPASLEESAVAIVGSRGATGYGRLMAERLGFDLARRGITVVSGLARGVDGAAHRGALAAGGKTIGVLGCGVDVVYPLEHRSLMERMAAEGGLLSELPPGTLPAPHHFPARNRIISGLCWGVVVVEAGERSGALITARLAMEQEREAMAVPGNATSPMSRGPHRLIREGAALVESADDVLEALGLKPGGPELRPAAFAGNRLPSARTVDGMERLVLEALTGQPAGTDDLVAATGLAAANVQAALMLLEMRDLATVLPGARYIRKM